MKTAIAIMSRVPIAGQTKTRLLNKISAEECAALHRACLADILAAAADTGLPGYLYWAGDYTMWARAEDDIQLRGRLQSFEARQQRGWELGERMSLLVEEILAEYDAVLLMGCDIPEIDQELLQEAANMLRSADIVLGPASDGGYYLIGLKKPAPTLFQDITWSTESVFRETMQKISSLNCSCQVAGVRQDLDTWDDLMEFYKRGRANEKHYEKLHSYKYVRCLVQKYCHDN